MPLGTTLGRVVAPLCASLLAACCTTCGGEGGPRAGGETPYVRCALAEEQPDRSIRAGRGQLVVSGRVVRIEGAAPPYRVAVLRGPAPGSSTLQPALDVVEAMSADVIVVMGSLGDDAPDVVRTLTELAAREVPTLILLGGRDARAHVVAALADVPHAERLVDLSGIRRVELGAVLIPVPGAPAGRYARTDDACGIGADDADEIANSVGDAADEVRLLLSWSAPSGSPVAMGFEGADAGDPIVRALAERIGATGGLYAFPETQIGRASGAGVGFEWVAPAATGHSALRADGSAASAGPVLFLVSSQGVSPAPL